jgi:phosphoribosylformylglycinamidine synthase
MAAAFDLAGFSATDVTMTDLLCGRENLVDFSGIAACGGFSFGDVLGAGLGWAKSILHQPGLRDLFATFFARQDTFALGVCNGCQMLAALKELIPGADAWPGFVRNRSEQFESRLVMVEIVESDSILFSGMAQSRLPIVVAHGEGRVQFERTADRDRLCQSSRVTLRYVDNYDRVTDRYPANPNGSADGVTGFCSQDGRVTIMMPHPERMVRTINCSWYPSDWGEFTPWLRIFQNARSFCD